MNWYDSAKIEDIMGNDEEVYSLDKMKELSTEHVELPSNGHLFYYREADGLHLNFFVGGFHTSDVDNKNVVIDKIWTGCGPTGNLRELRHSFFGENGYIFYVNLDILEAASKDLRRYFDPF